MAVQPGYAYAAVDFSALVAPTSWVGPTYNTVDFSTFSAPFAQVGPTYGAVVMSGEAFRNPVGDLMPGPTASTRYVMRAFKTTVPTGHIYWEVFEVADPGGNASPFPPYTLTDVVIVAEFCD